MSQIKYKSNEFEGQFEHKYESGGVVRPNGWPIGYLSFANIHAILTGVGKSWTLFEMFNELELELLFVTLLAVGMAWGMVGMFMFKALPHRLHGLRAARLNSPGISCRRSRLKFIRIINK